MHQRTRERAELIRMVQAGANVQMLAPRRIGKTWLMHKVAEDLAARGWLAVLVDVEGMRTEEEFLRALCQKLQEATTLPEQLLGNFAQRLRQFAAGNWEGSPINAIGRVDAKDFAEALVGTLQAQERDTLILVDEIALFVLERLARDAETIHAFLYHLRKLRQSYPRVRWLVTGSIGLDVVARRARLQGALVDLETFVLHPFDEAAARSYLDSLSRNRAIRNPFAIGDEEFSYLATELGWLAPYYLKLVADRIDPSGGVAESGLRLAQRIDIERAFEELLEPNRRLGFATWEEHIDKNFPGNEMALLHAILHACCEDTGGEQASTLMARLNRDHAALAPRQLMDLLTALHNGGHLEEADGRWRFRSGLVRRYWLKYLHE